MTSSPARSSASRVYPAGRAATLYAVCDSQLAGRRLSVEGRNVVALGFERFALLLSYVDRNSYTAEALKQRSDDRVWHAAEARVYERAVERASRHGVVLPMRLPTIVANTNELAAFVAENSLRWSRSLARLGGRRECVVHLVSGPHASLLTNEPYSIRIAKRVSRSARLPALEGSPAVVEFARSVWQSCTSLAQAVKRIAPVDPRGVIWSAVLLLGDGDVSAIARTLERSATAGAALGVTTYLEGPRAPFSFA